MIIIHSYEIRWLGSYTTWTVMALHGWQYGMGMDGWTDGRTDGWIDRIIDRIR